MYIETIEDIGQYRMNSKDIYSDKNIGKELLDIYALTSYYMAHQFHFLTKKLLDLLENKHFSQGYMTISG
jgi:hypothetical protein